MNLVFSILVVFGLVYSTTGNKCYGVTPNIDFSQNQNDMSHSAGNTLDSCCKRCQETSGCKGFTLNDSGDCYLKSGFGKSALHLKATAGFSTAENARIAGFDPVDSCFAVTPNLDYSSGQNDFQNHKATTLSHCCGLCKGTAKCTSFVYNKNNGICYLKNGYGKGVPNSNAISGFPSAESASAAGYSPNAQAPEVITKIVYIHDPVPETTTAYHVY